MAAPIEMYSWPTQNGNKITIALEEMELAYLFHSININRGEQHAPDFLAISPNNRIPAIIDPEGDNGAPLTIFESGAILQYLGRKTGKLYPKDERARTDVEQWLFWQVSGLGPMAGQAEHFIESAPKKVDDPAQLTYATKRYVDETARLYRVMDQRLADRDYLASDYSIADIACWPWVRRFRGFGQEIDAFPNVKTWLERIAQRPAVVRALALGADLRAQSNASPGQRVTVSSINWPLQQG